MQQNAPFPIRMTLIKANTIPTQMNDSINLFLLLNGSIKIMTAECEYLLHSDELLVINPFERYKVIGSEKNLFLYLQISREQMAQFTQLDILPYFDCGKVNKAEQQTEKYQKLKEILARLMAAYFKNQEETVMEVYQYLFTLLSHLTKNFKKTTNPSQALTITTNNDKINHIVEKIQTFYDQPMTLEELAEENDISYYHLSRLFKKHVGTTFTDYLNEIRLIHATESLLLTNQAIVKIALNNGFASANHFHQLFKKNYNMTPSAYRKERATEQVYFDNDSVDIADYQEISGKTALQELAKYLVEKDIDDESVIIKQQLSLAVPDGPLSPYKQNKKIIKIGQAFEGLAKAVQQELMILQKEIHFDLIQFTGFCEETNFESDVHLISEYIKNNQWFDFLTELKLKPMIQLCPPEELTMRKDMQAWCDKQLKILRHFLNRYGYKEVGKWYLEWLPTLQKGQEKDSNFWGYSYFYKKVKQLIPDCSIGIQSLVSLDEEDYKTYNSFLQIQKNEHCLPDFISFQADPYDTFPVKTEHALHFKEYQKDILTRVNNGISSIKKEAPENSWHPEVYLTNWNTLVGEGDTLAGTFFRSALILESIIELSEQVTGMAFWLNIKVKERQTHRREDSSLSVFLYEELKRPLFFSLVFLENMTGQFIAKGDGYLFTKTNGHYCLLLYNSSYLDPLYSVDSFQVQCQSKQLLLHLDNLPKGDYLIRHHILDKDRGGIYNDWIRVGGQTEIDLELLNYLSQKIMPEFELIREAVTSNRFVMDTTLTLNACHLYIFQPIY